MDVLYVLMAIFALKRVNFTGGKTAVRVAHTV